MDVSYAITVKNEINELKKLLGFLIPRIRKEDEIVIQMDKHASSSVKEFLESVSGITKITFPLNNHFANFKNNLNRYCSKTYILQLDADEMLTEYFVNNIHTILSANDIDLYWIPRINTVEGLTQEYIQMWRWNVNDKGWINFPDYQSRLFKRTSNIKWKNPVHEQIEGHDTFAYFPQSEEFAIVHHKQIERQKNQNEHYFQLRMMSDALKDKYGTMHLTNEEILNLLNTGNIKKCSWTTYKKAAKASFEQLININKISINTFENKLLFDGKMLRPFNTGLFIVAFPVHSMSKPTLAKMKEYLMQIDNSDEAKIDNLLKNFNTSLMHIVARDTED